MQELRPVYPKIYLALVTWSLASGCKICRVSFRVDVSPLRRIRIIVNDGNPVCDESFEAASLVIDILQDTR
jgi:hypothetical protein